MFSHHRARRIAQFALGIFAGTLVAWSMLLLPATPVVNAAPKATTRHVTKLADTDDGICDGDCSLREAINTAGAGDTIDFPALVGTITLSSTLGTLFVSQPITISGPGANIIKISGNNAIPVFNINASATISGVTVRDGNGNGSYGGGVLVNSGAVNIINSTIVSNTAPGFSGGGIANFGTLTVTNSSVISNTAGNGGGIHNATSGLLTLNNVTVTNNSVVSLGGGIHSAGNITITASRIGANQADHGGGIYASGNMLLTSDDIFLNTATSHGGGINTSDNTKTLTIITSTIRANSAGGSGSGGGVYNNSALTIIETNIFSNTALTGGGIASYSPVTVTTVNIFSNTAGSGGGGIYKVGENAMTLTGVTINNNTAADPGAGGGGIRAESSGSGTMTLTHVTISRNSADPTGTGWGGGILHQNLTAMLSHVTIVGNRAGSSGGGGIRTTGFYTMSFQNTLIANNIAPAGTDCDGAGPLVSLDYNFIRIDCSPLGTTTHNITGVDPKLTPLAWLGGLTPVHGLISGSPAINAIPNGTNGCGTTYTTDQRGFVRPAPGNTACDIGAFEGLTSALYLPFVAR